MNFFSRSSMTKLTLFGLVLSTNLTVTSAAPLKDMISPAQCLGVRAPELEALATFSAGIYRALVTNARMSSDFVTRTAVQW